MFDLVPPKQIFLRKQRLLRISKLQNPNSKNFPYILYTVWKKEKRIKKETKRKWEKHWGMDGSTVKRLKEAVMWFLVRVSVQI